MARWLKQRDRERWSWEELSVRLGHPVWKLRYRQRRLKRNGHPTRGRAHPFVAVEGAPAAGANAPIEIATPSGYSVHVPRDFDAAHLRRVLDWYEFTDSRKRDGSARVFQDFTCYLQADAYGGYDRLFFPGGAIEVACWAHVRRKFVDAEATNPMLAKNAIDRIRALFQIEDAAKDIDDAARVELRRARARPLVEEFRAWLDLAETQSLPKSPLDKTIVYACD